MKQPTIDVSEFSKIPIPIAPTHPLRAQPSESPIEELIQGVSLELEEAQSPRLVRKYRNLPKVRRATATMVFMTRV